MFRTVILFGAGASYGAGGIAPAAPPLGDSLIATLIEAYPNTWGSLGDDVLRRFRADGFEAGMGWVWQNMRNAPQVLQKALGHFFAQHHLAHPEACAYVSLLRGLKARLAGDPIMLATLNYELTLEESVVTAGLRWNYGDHLGAGSQALVVKPHGSCNFISGGLQLQGGVRFSTGITFESEPKVLSRQQAYAYCNDPNNNLPPSMVVFMEGKPTAVCPNLLRAMQEAFDKVVREAKTVLIVGVNPHIVDTHIWDCISETDAEIVFCGDETAYEKWQAECRCDGPARFVGRYFAEAVGDLVAAV